jgi:phage terminase large subunit
MTRNKPSLNPALRDFWKTRARNKVLYGGRASSKSWDAAGFAVCLASNYRTKFLCVRQIQNKITDSVYSLLKIQIERFGLSDQFEILKNTIIHKRTGSEFLFYGLWRNIEELKSIESVDVLWSEESHGLTESQWDILEPTIRKEGSECWIIFNPDLRTDFVYKKFIINTPPDTILRHINYTENPFLSQTMLKIIEDAKNEDYERYEHIYLGKAKSNDEESIIKLSWIESAIDAHKKLNISFKGAKRIGYDVADSGGDTCAVVLSHGIVARAAKEWNANNDELEKSATMVYDMAFKNNCQIVYDSIGVGASCGSMFKSMNERRKKKIKYDKFNAGEKVQKPKSFYQEQIKNKDMFANLKAQYWWKIADRFRNTHNAIVNGKQYEEEELISIESSFQNLEKLKEELSNVKKDIDTMGRVKVESKKDLLARGVKSPNLADAFIMAFYNPVRGGLLNTMD